jgi:enoyl-CoA hydratase/carnithine racemase
MPNETVLVDIDAGVAVVTWNRPRQRNAFSQQMWLEGRDTLRELLEDRAVRAVVVTGRGGVLGGAGPG